MVYIKIRNNNKKIRVLILEISIYSDHNNRINYFSNKDLNIIKSELYFLVHICILKRFKLKAS